MTSHSYQPEEARLLGKTVGYPQTYCPEILVAVPRSLNRDIYGISYPDQLFCGTDSWHAYEAGFLTDKGLPVTGMLKIVYPSTSTFLVESKSLKLYLGSYHMHRMGDRAETAAENFVRQVEADLSHLLATSVKAFLHTRVPAKRPFDFEDYRILEESISPETAIFSVYQERPAYLREHLRPGGEIRVGSHLLKSNCKITHQPDWGSIYIHMRAGQLPDELSLLRYIVSLRNENHFHEEICEMTFKRLSDFFKPEVLSVACLYTRRGGIDICPVRANAPEYLPYALSQANIWTEPGFRQ